MPIPVTILTGFLWSGKTTLLNHILRWDHGFKIAVIENEFGREGIDADLVEESREELIQISNGCICCIVRGDFIAAVERLLSSGKHIDYIIVEASGMSEPLPVAQSFLMNNFAGRIRLDGIICLVDALNFTTNVVQNTETASEQITYSDIIVLNKTDLVNEKQKNEILTFIKTLNTRATLFESSYGKIDIRYLIDTHAFSLTEETEEEMHHHAHHHENGFSEFMYKSTMAFDIERFENFIRDLPLEVFRIKGFCIFDGLPDVYLLQKVWWRLTIDPIKEISTRETKLVFIGTGLDTPFLQKWLNDSLRQKNPLFL